LFILERRKEEDAAGEGRDEDSREDGREGWREEGQGQRNCSVAR